jgi:hypothetical protein
VGGLAKYKIFNPVDWPTAVILLYSHELSTHPSHLEISSGSGRAACAVFYKRPACSRGVRHSGRFTWIIENVWLRLQTHRRVRWSKVTAVGEGVCIKKMKRSSLRSGISAQYSAEPNAAPLHCPSSLKIDPQPGHLKISHVLSRWRR